MPMDGMWWLLVGVVIGGLALWIFMRERVLRLEAEIDAFSHKKTVEASKAPEVKTRSVGGGSKSTAKAEDIAPAKDEPSEDEEEQEATALASDADEEPVAEEPEEPEEAEAPAPAEAEPEDEEPASAEEPEEEKQASEPAEEKKKPSLKLPEPSSATEDKS